VVEGFIGVKAKALGAEVLSSLTPGQAFIGILHSELVALMGGAAAGFRLRAQPPVVVLLAGLQGAGKTTTAAKLARLLIERDRKRVGSAPTCAGPPPCCSWSASPPRSGPSTCPRMRAQPRPRLRRRPWRGPGAACSTC
jgi:hypothetical protein